MLNLRTIVLSVGLVLILILTVPLVAARTEVVSDPASDAASVSENQRQAADLINTYNAPSYRSQFGECFDVPIRELAACRDASQAEPSPIDECFDVPLSEAAACRTESQTLFTSHRSSYRSQLDECSDVSYIELASCRNASQTPAP